MVGVAFGGLWSVSGALGLPAAWRLPAAAAGVLVTFALLASVWRAGAVAATGGPLFRRRAYLVAVALEAVGIWAASVLLPQAGLSSFLAPATGAIVGLHFIGLWRADGSRRFLWIAGSMCAVAALAALLPDAVSTGAGPLEARQATVGIGEALVLWLLAGRASRGAAPVS